MASSSARDIVRELERRREARARAMTSRRDDGVDGMDDEDEDEDETNEFVDAMETMTETTARVVVVVVVVVVVRVDEGGRVRGRGVCASIRARRSRVG
jgi:hypothetical protein